MPEGFDKGKSDQGIYRPLKLNLRQGFVAWEIYGQDPDTCRSKGAEIRAVLSAHLFVLHPVSDQAVYQMSVGCLADAIKI